MLNMTAAANPALDAALAKLGRFHPTAIDLSLGRIEQRLAALGHPERKLPPVFHVAGTNGKGSTIAFLRAFLEAAGYRCHAYTSPHLVRFNERIRVAGQLIDDDALLGLIEEVEAAGRERPITTFEITTAIALLAFSRTPADATLIEVGLGGRYDATNVFERPHAVAVTRVSFDHRQFLGDTLSAIAAEKAGIFKPDVPAIIADQPSEEVREVLIAEGVFTGAPLILHGQSWSVTPTESGFRYQGPGRLLDLPSPALVGRHQYMNAGTALTMLDAAGGFAISDEAVRRAVSAVEWPGRLQRLTRGPLVDSLPRGIELWLDGAHNDSGGEIVAGQAERWRDRPLDVVIGILASKQPREILAPLAPFVGRLKAVAIPTESPAMPPDEIADAARAVGIRDAEPAASVAEAVAALARPGGPRRILIMGSLYLAGAILAENG
jgi:dihydrofolate synthase/folylpolyglutamate synthase